jgi:haloalkane dehalogenase
MRTTSSAIEEIRVPLPSVGFATRVLRAGAGTPVLLLHGNPDNAAEWRPVLTALGGEVAGIAPDLPGFGGSDEPPPSFDFSRFAHESFLDDLLTQLDIHERLVLVVHDIGGVLGVPWAAKHVERIRGVVLTNTVVFEGFPWFPLARAWSRTDVLGRAQATARMWLMGQADGLIFRRIFGAASPELPADELERITREFALDGKAKRSTLRLFRRMIPPAYFDGMDAAVRDLIARVPVRIVWGEGDPYIPVRYADSFPGAQREIIPRGGHWIPISSPARVADAIRAVIAAGP